jgi:hypothetical protein
MLASNTMIFASFNSITMGVTCGAEKLSMSNMTCQYLSRNCLPFLKNQFSTTRRFVLLGNTIAKRKLGRDKQ